MPMRWLQYLTERAPAAYSVRALLFCLAIVAAATLVRFLFGYINPNTIPFASYFPAVLLIALIAGTPAALLATVLSILAAALLFPPEAPDWPLEFVNYAFFVASCALIIVIAHSYRWLVANYRAQERQKNLMLRELEHRGKNTFTVVQAIVSQTLSDDRARAEAITGRIRAVSSTNDIISHAANLQPDLRTLIRAKFEPFGELRANLDGATVTLPADAARNLSLVFHELVTNAIKHGALSKPEGRIDIAWHTDAGDTLTITWTERKGPAIRPPAQRGFGTKLVVGCMKSLGGTVDAAFPPDGLVCKLKLPLGRAA